MVQKGVVLSHIISNKGIEVDKVKIELIEKLSNPTFVMHARSFHGNVRFSSGSLMIFQRLQNLLSNCLSMMCLLTLMRNVSQVER